MKEIKWSEKKNKWLQKERGVSFEQVEKLIKQGKILDNVEHPNQRRYPGQRKFVLAINNYIHTVPYVKNNQEIFLKTIIPSRKEHKKYGKKQ